MSNFDNKQLVLITKLDAPPKMFLWDFDQAFIVVGLAGIGIVSGMWLSMTCLGFVLGHYWQKFKGGKSVWFLIHGAFWFLPIKNKSTRIGNSSEREFLG
jgi:type IV conjugative transfer system protein TraL